MKRYYVTKTKEAEPSVLSVFHEGKEFNFSLLHSSVTTAESYRDGEYGHPHSHGVYHMILYLDGENCISLNGRKRKVNRGSLLLVDPGVKHDFYPMNKGRLEYAEITFEYLAGKQNLSLSFQDLLRKISRNGDIRIPRALELDEQEIALGRELFFEFGNLQKDYRLGTFTIHLKMLEIFEKICRKLYRDNGSNLELAERTASYLQNHLTEKLNLDTLSREMHCSKTYLNREFRKFWNRSPMEYHKSLRLEKAADLLRSSEKSLKEIASFFQFYDEFHFSRSFQSLYGMPPGEFRKQNRI